MKRSLVVVAGVLMLGAVGILSTIAFAPVAAQSGSRRSGRRPSRSRT